MRKYDVSENHYHNGTIRINWYVREHFDLSNICLLGKQRVFAGRHRFPCLLELDVQEM